jgi:hypothetical protein
MITNFFSPLSFVTVFDPGSAMGKNQDPGSGINIPDPPHWFNFIKTDSRGNNSLYFKQCSRSVTFFNFCTDLDPDQNLQGLLGCKKIFFFQFF